MLRGLEIRLYPNTEQKVLIDQTLGCCRFVYNNALYHKIEEYDKGVKLNKNDISKYFHGELRKNGEYSFLLNVNTKVVKQSLNDLDTAYQNFFKYGDRVGYPNFKSKRDVNKARFPKEAISKDTFKNGKLNLTTDINNLKFRCSDRDRKHLIDNKDKIRSITITRAKSGKYMASVLIDSDLAKTVPEPKNNIIGIDFGIKTLMVMSNGETIENPKWTRSNEKKIKKLQKEHSKKSKARNKVKYSDDGQKISNQEFIGANKEKARLKLAKAHERISNQKNDFMHNLTTKIISENQVIVLEDLNVKGMMKNHNLAKAIQEVSFSELKRMLEYKAKWYNREVITVDRFFASSKLCSGCGWKNTELTLSDREFICKNCGLCIDRDLNAASNLVNEGLNMIGQRVPESSVI